MEGRAQTIERVMPWTKEVAAVRGRGQKQERSACSARCGKNRRRTMRTAETTATST